MVNIDGSLLPISGYFSFMALSMLSLAFSVKIFFIVIKYWNPATLTDYD